jgi:hypothetical protein
MTAIRLLPAVALLVSFAATANPEPIKPEFSQKARDAFFARTQPLVGDLVVAPALPQADKRKISRKAKRRQANNQRKKRNSSGSGSAAEAQMKRENCQLMKQMYRSQVRDGGVVAVDRNGREFILRGARAEAAIAKAKQDVARWCN